MKIKWVDDTHALGVFASESAGMRRCAAENVVAAAQVKTYKCLKVKLMFPANHALSIVHPMLKARSLAQGGKKAKGRAFRSAGNSFSSVKTSRNRYSFSFLNEMVVVSRVYSASKGAS